MTPNKMFTGFLSSTSNPGQLSLTMQSLTKAVLSFAALWAVIHGLDAQAITSQVQSVIDTVATAVTAGMAFYHTVMAVYGGVHKLYYFWFAKQVVTPAAAPTSVPVATGEMTFTGIATAPTPVVVPMSVDASI